MDPFYLLKFILDNDITICNRGPEPTFIAEKEIIDGELLKVAECSLTDHTRILFSIDIGTATKKPIRKPNRVL